MNKDKHPTDIELLGKGTTPLPVADYGTRPVTPHPLDTIGMVRQFMLTAGQEVKESPAQPSPEVLKLRLALELEELYEKAQAFGLENTFRDMLYSKCGVDAHGERTDDIFEDTGIYNAVEVLDAAVDQRYVQDGTVLACGLQGAFPEAFAEVQRSNMSKFPANAEELAATIEKYNREGVPVKAEFASADKAFPMVVTRAADGKVLKNTCYSPASLAPILRKFTT